ncbi:hypothetical protein [Crocosphaera watsonii]|uniref:hypothetical protein n=1 Tax=Crocosphaera watsonii TaxID=263511 RepID=UPI0003185314|nr:hypothetical protein [Crocosphaera watsonii]
MGFDNLFELPHDELIFSFLPGFDNVFESHWWWKYFPPVPPEMGVLLPGYELTFESPETQNPALMGFFPPVSNTFLKNGPKESPFSGFYFQP